MTREFKPDCSLEHHQTVWKGPTSMRKEPKSPPRHISASRDGAKPTINSGLTLTYRQFRSSLDLNIAPLLRLHPTFLKNHNLRLPPRFPCKRILFSDIGVLQKSPHKKTTDQTNDGHRSDRRKTSQRSYHGPLSFPGVGNRYAFFFSPIKTARYGTVILISCVGGVAAGCLFWYGMLSSLPHYGSRGMH